MSPADIGAVVLLGCLGFVLGGGGAMVYLVRRQLRVQRLLLKRQAEQQAAAVESLSRFTLVPFHPVQVRRPSRWLAIRSRDTRAVQLALGLQSTRPCSWTEGLLVSQDYFITPPVQGWTLVFGDELPVPDDDVDAFYGWMRDLSRRLGLVQFFQADELLQHHAWVQVESGRVRRAYAWAGTTLWNQGLRTVAEVELGMNCYSYDETPGQDDWLVAGHLVANVEKVFHLARRWSLDPAAINLQSVSHLPGVAGSRRGGN